MEACEQGYDDDRFQSDVSQNLHCVICLNVFKDPVMCQRNQHFFCRPCIERHLKNSQTCPTCMEELTLETLNRAPRILTDWLSELNIRCDNSNRGCREFVQLGDLESHVKNCGFSPVVCSNQGCLLEINKRDQTYHESEICEFRKVKCHNCRELKKDVDEMKINMTTLTEKLEAVERNVATVRSEMQEMIREIKDQLTTVTDQMVQNIQIGKEKTTNESQEARSDSGKRLNVVIAGGHNGKRELNSVEKFSLTNKSWSPLQPMQDLRLEASSFVYRDQIILTGGRTRSGYTDTMERVNINPVMGSEPWFDFPAKLPVKIANHNSILYEERLIVIGGYDGCKCSQGIYEVLLVPPHTSKLLTRMPQARCSHGAQLFNHKIFICGGRKMLYYGGSVDSVIIYDISENKCKQMSPLPYAVSDMATVSWGDNVIVIGGADKDGKVLNAVVVYNVKIGKSQMLPAMKYRRKGCVAVVVDNSIIVMGGIDGRGNYLNSVESFSFGSCSWV